jgi:hypothetical protein
MTVLHVDGLDFILPGQWLASKYDDWSFYRNQFARIGSGIKAVDLIAISADAVWVVEVKDYRVHRRTKTVDMAQEFADKVLHTLSALLPAKLNAAEQSERDFAARVLASSRLRLVLHLEQPAKHSKLFPRSIDPANIKLKIKQKLKAIDPHPVVAEMGKMQDLPWSVANRSAATGDSIHPSDGSHVRS